VQNPLRLNTLCVDPDAVVCGSNPPGDTLLFVVPFLFILYFLAPPVLAAVFQEKDEYSLYYFDFGRREN
jgi:hypothetical protein